MTDFEPFDDDLANALQRRAPDVDMAGIAAASAHNAVLARARGIRRRRAGIAGGATLAAFIAAGVLLLTGNGDDTLAPATEPSTSTAPETSALATTSTSVAPTSTPTPPSTAMPPSTAVAPTETVTTAPPVVTVPETVPGTSVGVQPPVSVVEQSSASSSSTSSSSTSSTVAIQGPAPSTKTYNSSGGSITVSWNGSALSLDSVNAAAGYTAEIEDNSSTRVRVRFVGPADSRIEIRFENGDVTERID
jgi:hypothetical protein